MTAARIRAQFPTSDGFGDQLKGCCRPPFVWASYNISRYIGRHSSRENNVPYCSHYSSSKMSGPGKYKDRYIIITLLKTPPRYYSQYREHLESTQRTNWTRVVRSNTTKDLPNTHRRSTAETAMNPIGQTFPVIHIHLVGNFQQTVRVELQMRLV